MTIETANPTRRRPLGPVGNTVSDHIRGLQKGYLDDRGDAVAAIARIRRGAGKPSEDMPDLWGLLGTEPLYEPGRLGEGDTDRAADAAYIALTLWALHQQSHRVHRMHVPGGHELGSAVRRLMPGMEIDEPIRKRFVRAGSAPHLIALAERLRDIVQLLRREEIPLDYGLLADQLYRWQQPGGRQQIRRAWGTAFHAYRDPKTAPATAADASPDDDTDTTTDKDDVS
ncbi:type I-E CRISPR-associated protein Cse2/CasB [Embleya sp. NPDC020886]|uniref:type I-E CRISPR-associated protein Cse2/CasB n=1 Tax=Embleya sp. NPDC020886 TaxID=3363980 RepID=UPI00379350D4